MISSQNNLALKQPSVTEPQPVMTGTTEITELPTFPSEASLPAAHKLAQHFEKSPEPLFGAVIPGVINASTGVREHTTNGLRLFRISEVFNGDREVFLGFGIPNVYLAFPNEEKGYDKFAGKSLKRAPSKVEHTKGLVQSGILLHLENLPEEAIRGIRQASTRFHGKKFWTCVNANCRVLDEAGFTTGGKPLKNFYLPIQLLTSLRETGLEFKGKPVSFQFIRTTPNLVETHALAIAKAELLTIYRHSAGPWIEKTFIGRWLHNERRPAFARKPVAPALAETGLQDINIKVSRPVRLAMVMRWLWGPHTLFTASQSRVSVNDFLPERLKEFPQPNPGVMTRIKKSILFSRPVVSLVTKILRPDFESLGEKSESSVYDMLPTDASGRDARFNLVVTPENVTLSRLKVKFGLVDWILTKHVLVSNYHPDVRFAGEAWKDKDGVIHISRNSGTYRPSGQQLDAALEYLRKAFPHLKFQKSEI